MSEATDKLSQELRNLLDRTIRVDMNPQALDPYFLTQFILYWVASQPVGVRTGKAVVVDLIQAGLRSKYKDGDTLIKLKIETYCRIRGVSVPELLEALAKEMGHDVSPIAPESLEVSEGSLNFLLGEK
jgi:hypothetical protein